MNTLLNRRALMVVIALCAALIAWANECLGSEKISEQTEVSPLKIQFAGREFIHRWSKDNQHEFTPEGEEDLQRWMTMVTINVFPGVANGEALAATANNVLALYQQNGVVVHSASVPRREGSEAEHLAVAVLGNKNMAEAAFARIKMVESIGAALVLSHRIYGEQAREEIGRWLQENGDVYERAIMNWQDIPSPSSLNEARSD